MKKVLVSCLVGFGLLTTGIFLTSSQSHQSRSSWVWQCTVDGHIHYGENPPEKCPVCGRPSSVFKQGTGLIGN